MRSKSRTRAARRDILRSKVKTEARKIRSRARVRDLQKRNYTEQAYDGSDSEES